MRREQVPNEFHGCNIGLKHNLFFSKSTRVLRKKYDEAKPRNTMREEATPFWGHLDSETTSTPRANEAQVGSGMPIEGIPLREKTGEETTPKPRNVVVEAKKFEFPPNSYRRSNTSKKPPQSGTLLQARMAESTPLIKKGAAIAVGLVVGMALIFIVLIISNIEFVNMADEHDERMLWGPWWNPSESLMLDSNGSIDPSESMMLDSDGSVNMSSREPIDWALNGENITLIYMIDGEPYLSTWKYEIRYTDTKGDRFLFMAPYVVENGTITNEVVENSCIAYVDSFRGLDEDFFESHRGMAPSWCVI